VSRIGKQPVSIPDDVEVRVDDNILTVEGPEGSEEFEFHQDMIVEVTDGMVTVSRPSDSKYHRSVHGMTRSIIQNAVQGVKEGFQKALEIHGVGYTAQRKTERKILLNVGFSHSILFEAPEGITLEVPDNTHITVRGTNKALVGEVAAKIRSFRPPEPYKGKGIRYVGEYVRRKAGKAAAAK